MTSVQNFADVYPSSQRSGRARQGVGGPAGERRGRGRAPEPLPRSPARALLGGLPRLRAVPERGGRPRGREAGDSSQMRFPQRRRHANRGERTRAGVQPRAHGRGRPVELGQRVRTGAPTGSAARDSEQCTRRDLSGDLERSRRGHVPDREHPPASVRVARRSCPSAPIRRACECFDDDPYSYRLQIVLLPAYSERFQDMEFRQFVEETIRFEVPAHLLPKICWVDAEAMKAVEQAYKAWLAARARGRGGRPGAGSGRGSSTAGRKRPRTCIRPKSSTTAATRRIRPSSSIATPWATRSPRSRANKFTRGERAMAVRINLSLAELSHQYTVFERNQVLSDVQLNGVTDYLNDQDRLSRPAPARRRRPRRAARLEDENQRHRYPGRRRHHRRRRVVAGQARHVLPVPQIRPDRPALRPVLRRRHDARSLRVDRRRGRPPPTPNR